MRNLLLICLLSFAGASLAQEPVVEPVIEEQGASSEAPVSEKASVAPEPVIEREGAQETDPALDPPDRVARLSLTEGEVSLAPAGTEEWAEAILNRPLTTGDRVWVDNGGRAELQVGSATIHLDEGSGISFVDLDDDVLHLSLTEGSANIRVLTKRDNERIEIDTPNATVTLLHPGEYHVEANSAGDETIVRARNGDAEVSAGAKTWRVGGNQEGVFTGTDQLAARIDRLGPRTAFEDWANDRNRRSENSPSSRYVSTEVIGYEDLDRHGSWRYEPSYGYVWAPTYVAAGWAPYRFGRWVWVSPWGWSWVDNSAWGFAPFHYGRWTYLQSRWCWVPGPRHIRPVYAPALVAWTSLPGASVSVSFGSGIGWFPLGPREVYVPGYRYSRRYLNNVNVSNTVIVNNTYITNVYNGRHPNFDYRYGRNPRAVTIVERDRFVSGRPLNGNFSRQTEADLRRWNRDARPPALAPSRDSVFASRVLGRIPGRSITQPQAERLTSQNQTVASRRPSLSRVPFDVERREIEANGGRPVARSQLIRSAPSSEVAQQRPNGQQWRDGGREPSGSDPRARLGRRDDVAVSRPGLTNEQSSPRSSNPVLSDRPSWATRQRVEDQRRFQSGDARGGSGDPRGQGNRGDGFSRRLETSPGSQGNASDVTRNQLREQQETRTPPPVNSLRRQSPSEQDRGADRPQRWRSNDSQDRIQRSSPVEQNRSLGSGSNARPEWRTQQRPQGESPRITQPRVAEPRVAEPTRRYEPPARVEQPRRVEQPQRAEQPRRVESQRSSSDSSRSNFSRSTDSGRSGNHSGRQGIQQQR